MAKRLNDEGRKQEGISERVDHSKQTSARPNSPECTIATFPSGSICTFIEQVVDIHEKRIPAEVCLVQPSTPSFTSVPQFQFVGTELQAQVEYPVPYAAQRSLVVLKVVRSPLKMHTLMGDPRTSQHVVPATAKRESAHIALFPNSPISLTVLMLPGSGNAI